MAQNIAKRYILLNLLIYIYISFFCLYSLCVLYRLIFVWAFFTLIAFCLLN